MKNGLLILNVILLILVGILFYLHFSSRKATPVAAPQQTQSSDEKFRIAYFDMDSLANSFSMVVDAKAELARREESLNAEKAKMERNYKEKLDRYQAQAQANAMTQVQSEAATKDMLQLQQQIQTRGQAMEQEYQDFYTRKMRDVKDKIEAYLKEYNTGKGFTYIVAYEPGLFYYRDSAYDITADVIRGLNEKYKTAK